MVRQVARSLHRLVDRLGTQVRGARGPFALPKIDGDAQTAVAFVLEGFDFPAADTDRIADSKSDLGLNRIRAARARTGERPLHSGLQCGQL